MDRINNRINSGIDNLENKIDSKLNQVTQKINQEVDQLGNSLDHLVQNAVDSSNYRDLSAKIDNLVSQGVDQIQNTIRQGSRMYYDPQTGQYQPYQQSRPYQQGRPYQQSQQYRQQTAPGARRDLFVRSGGLLGVGIACLAAGIILTVLFGIFTAVCIAMMAGGSFMFAAAGAALGALIFFLVFLAAGIVFDVFGFGRIKLTQRYKKYVTFLNGRVSTTISDLSYAVQIPEQTVRRDVKKIIQKQWFREGHLDEEEQILMLTHASWEEYCRSEKQRRASRRRQQEEKRREEAFGNQNPQAMAVLQEGEKYLNEIRACNDAITQPDITEKITRMEILTKKIFDRIREKPEQVDEIQKLMKYYLPTAIKLLHAYEELNAQSVQGENIINSKREIEAALDTLNAAFEKLLDNLFQDIAWDVSSDISVLNTILAQEGLKDDGSGFTDHD